MSNEEQLVNGCLCSSTLGPPALVPQLSVSRPSAPKILQEKIYE